MDEIKSADDAGKLAELYKAFADETRVRIMISLGEGAKCR